MDACAARQDKDASTAEQDIACIPSILRIRRIYVTLLK
jgi:hypothetical protein